MPTITYQPTTNENPWSNTNTGVHFDFAPGKQSPFGTMSYHGIGLGMGVDTTTVMGRIQSWNPQIMSRQGSHLWELNFSTFGVPIDYVPGRTGEPSASVGRTEVWNDEFEIALGYSGIWTTLADQDRPFQVIEYWYKGADRTQPMYRTWQYVGCWFTEKNYDSYDAEGDAIVKTSATINFVARFKIL